MDTRPQLFRDTPRTRPTVTELVPPLLGLLGAAAFLGGIVVILVWLSSI